MATQTVFDRFVGDRAEIGGDPLPKFERHPGRSEQTDKAVERQRRIARFLHRRQIRLGRSALRVGHREELDLARLPLRPHDRQRGLVDLYAALGEIVGRIHRILVGDFADIQTFLLQPAGKHEIERAGHAGPVELARLAAGERNELVERIDAQARRHGDGDDRVGYARNRHEIARRVGQVVVQKRMRGERRGRRK